MRNMAYWESSQTGECKYIKPGSWNFQTSEKGSVPKIPEGKLFIGKWLDSLVVVELGNNKKLFSEFSE